jgi:hypothetical protein
MKNDAIPEHYLITPGTKRGDFNAFIARLANALLSGIKLVQLRVRRRQREGQIDPDLPPGSLWLRTRLGHVPLAFKALSQWISR